MAEVEWESEDENEHLSVHELMERQKVLRNKKVLMKLMRKQDIARENARLGFLELTLGAGWVRDGDLKSSFCYYQLRFQPERVWKDGSTVVDQSGGSTRSGSISIDNQGESKVSLDYLEKEGSLFQELGGKSWFLEEGGG